MWTVNDVARLSADPNWGCGASPQTPGGSAKGLSTTRRNDRRTAPAPNESNKRSDRGESMFFGTAQGVFVEGCYGNKRLSTRTGPADGYLLERVCGDTFKGGASAEVPPAAVGSGCSSRVGRHEYSVRAGWGDPWVLGMAALAAFAGGVSAAPPARSIRWIGRIGAVPR